MATTGNIRTLRKQLFDVVERTAVTAVEAVGAVLLTKGSLSFSTGEVALLGAIAGGLAAVRTVVAKWLSSQRGPQEWLEDMFSRAIFTFAQTLISALAVSAAPGLNLNLSSVKAAALAGVAAALAAVKGALARGVVSDPVFTPASLVPAAAAKAGNGPADPLAGGDPAAPVVAGSPAVAAGTAPQLVS
jgi:hypothetical protein